MKQAFTNYDQLPIMLNAEQIAQLLGISRAGAYQLMHTTGFPLLRIGKRMVTPKEKLLKWIEDELSRNNEKVWFK